MHDLAHHPAPGPHRRPAAPFARPVGVGPGLPLTGWSLHHGDLRVAHFVGLHMLQVLPVLAWLLLRLTRLDERARRDLLRVAGVGAIALVALLWWQAERGQALLEPDATTIGAAVVLVVGTATGAAAVLVTRARRPGGR